MAETQDLINQLQSKGIVDILFHLLWLKDPILNTHNSFMIPDTIILNKGVPQVWYFLSKDNRIKKHSKNKLNREQIIKTLSQKTKKSGISAVFKYKESGNRVITEYLTSKDLISFFDRAYQPNGGSGMLQQFIQPKGDHNFVIKVNWSKQLCLYDKKENIQKINDQKIDVFERAVCYDGEEYSTKSGPLRGYLLPNLLENYCANIAQHVANVSLDLLVINRMVCDFKVGEDQNIWLMQCQSMEVQDANQKPNAKDILIEQIPQNIDLKQINNGGKKSTKNMECSNCNELFTQSKLLTMRFKDIMLWFPKNETDIDNNQIDKENNDTNKPKVVDQKMMEEKLIPKIVKNLYPEISYKEYKEFAENPIFLQKKLLLCENCFMKISQKNLYSGEQPQQVYKQDPLFGTGLLRPNYKKNIESTHVQIQIKKAQAQTEKNFFQKKPVANPIFDKFNYTSNYEQFQPLPLHKYQNLNSQQNFYTTSLSNLSEQQTQLPIKYKMSSSISDMKSLHKKDFQVYQREYGTSQQFTQLNQENKPLQQLLGKAYINRQISNFSDSFLSHRIENNDVVIPTNQLLKSVYNIKLPMHYEQIESLVQKRDLQHANTMKDLRYFDNHNAKQNQIKNDISYLKKIQNSKEHVKNVYNQQLSDIPNLQQRQRSIESTSGQQMPYQLIPIIENQINNKKKFVFKKPSQVILKNVHNLDNKQINFNRRGSQELENQSHSTSPQRLNDQIYHSKELQKNLQEETYQKSKNINSKTLIREVHNLKPKFMNYQSIKDQPKQKFIAPQ